MTPVTVVSARGPRYPDGFSLLVVLLWLILLLPVLLLIQTRVADHITSSVDVEGQLHSLVLAGNGIEYARALLPRLDLDRTLVGVDGSAGGQRGEWRNPVSFGEARTLDISKWRHTRDDGLPHDGNRLLLPAGFPLEGGGKFYLRFTNNPEESPYSDRDRVVVVRSMGVVPIRFRNPLLPWTRNNTVLVEAILRQERTFEVPAAITIFASRGEFTWEGSSFRVDGEEAPSLLLLGDDRLQVLSDLQTSVRADQRSLFRSAMDPAWSVDSEKYRTVPDRVVRYSEFWSHFQEQLPVHAAARSEGLHYFPDGAVLSESFEGVLVAQGNLRLQDEFHLTGLLIHLGGGAVEMADRSKVEGGVWMSDLDLTGTLARGRTIGLKLSGSARVRYAPDAIESALHEFPPTQLSWRILHPEMQR